MPAHNALINGLISATALVILSANAASDAPLSTSAFIETHASAFRATSADSVTASGVSANSIAAKANAALAALSDVVRPLSHPKALESAVRSYFAFLSANPDEVKKPYLYFVDYGLPSTEPRGYVFDMRDLRVVDGPFTVAHGRGSANANQLVPSRFSNASGSNATSLGLFVAQQTYTFRGKSAGRPYKSIGLRLEGVSGEFNENARARGVVVHGAPYVTTSKAGRSEGCPAVEQERAQELIPRIANGGLVFLFAPDAEWMSSDPWLVASGD